MSDTNAGLGMVPHKPHCRCDECKIERLERALKLQRSAALTLADASAATSSARLEQARKLFAESRPESVESERAMNAILTADVDRLERELAKARRTAEYWKAEHLAGNEQIDAARAEAEALRKEAARYRWLRNESLQRLIRGPICIDADTWGEPVMACGKHITLDGSDLDAAIDATIAKEQKP